MLTRMCEQMGGIVHVAGGCKAPYDTRESVSDGATARQSDGTAGGRHSACRWWLLGAIRHSRERLRWSEGGA
jgi:hypothetical protein